MKNCSTLRMKDGGVMTRWAQNIMRPTQSRLRNAEAPIPQPVVAAPPVQTAAPVTPDNPAGIRFRNGGDLRTGHGGHVPGSGSGDKIDAKYEPGEFVVSNDMLDNAPGLREQLQGLRGEVLAAKGMTPAEADAKAVRYDDDSPRSQDGQKTRDTGQDLDVRSPLRDGALRVAGPSFDDRVFRGGDVHADYGHSGKVQPLSLRAKDGFEDIRRPWTGTSPEATAFKAGQTGPFPNAAPAAPVAPAAASMKNPMNWAQGVRDAGRVAGQGTASAVGSGAKVISEAGKAVATGAVKNINSVANVVGATAAHGNAFFDPKVSTGDKLRIGATDATAALGGGVAGLFGGAAGSVVPVAGTIAGGLTGAYLGERYGRKLGDAVFGGSESLRRNGYDPERDVIDIGKDALKNGFSDDLFGVKTGRAGGGRGFVNPPLVNPDAPAASAPANPAAPGTMIAGDATMPAQDVARGPTLRGQGGTSIDGAPGVSKFTQNGKTLYSNVTGPDNDKLMSNNPGVSVVPGMNRQSIDAALGGLSASQVSSDNAIRAANLRDGVDMERGTVGGKAAEEDRRLNELALSPAGTNGRTFAQKQLGLRMTDATTRRGQDIDVARTTAASKAAADKVVQDQKIADRTFAAGRDDAVALRADKSADNQRAAGKAFDERITGMVPTIDGKPDGNAAAAIRVGANAFLANKQAEVEAALKKDPTNRRALAVKEELKKGLDGLDEDTIRTFVLGQAGNQVAKEYDGLTINPFAGKAKNTQTPVTRLRLQDNFILPNQYETDNGQLIPQRAVEANPDLRKLIR